MNFRKASGGNLKNRIQIVPLNNRGFVHGYPGVPPNDEFEHGARIKGEVHISLPLLGVPASSIELKLQKTESIAVHGGVPFTSVEVLAKDIIWQESQHHPQNIFAGRCPFTISIPEDLPPTVALDKQGIEIRYSMVATVYRANKRTWSAKPYSCTQPLFVEKYETHPAWPINRKPLVKNVESGNIRLSTQCERACYVPGEIINLKAKLVTGSHRVTPRSIKFDFKFEEVVTVYQKPGLWSSSSEKSRKRVLDQQSKVCTKSDSSEGGSFSVDFTTKVPVKDVRLTLTSAKHIRITYTLVVSTEKHSEHLLIELPIVISPWKSDSPEEIQNIGSVPSFGGHPSIDNLPGCSGSKYAEDSSGGRDEKAPPTPRPDDLPSDNLAVPLLPSSPGPAKVIQVVPDRLEARNRDLGHRRNTGSSIYTFVSDSTVVGINIQDYIDDLTEILRSSKKTQALQELRGSRAQAVVDFLDLVLLEVNPAMTWLRKHTLIALYKLCKASHLHPECYSLRNITLLSQEAGGGFADIHRGKHENQTLCLKVVRVFQKSTTKEMLKLFAKEAVLWSHLDHPNILPFYGIYYLDEERQRMCLVSPWMDNGNLVTYLQNNPTGSRRPFIKDVIMGMEYLHDKGIIHGDLKGVNVLVTADRRACICDFGLSSVLVEKSISTAEMTSAIHAGTYRWVAPELLLGDTDIRPTQASDVWAFACVVYQILTRQVPFHGSNTDAAVIARILRLELPTRPTKTFGLDSIDDEMWLLLKQCWSNNPDDRPNCLRILDLLGLVWAINRPENDERSNSQTVEFRNAMRVSDVVTINHHVVKDAFSEIRTAGNTA